jgi:tetratricopeptide (TPR) repeat protein
MDSTGALAKLRLMNTEFNGPPQSLMNKSSKTNSMVYICVLALFSGLFAFWLNLRSQEKKDDDTAKMAQNVLASNAIPKMEANDDYTEGMKQLNAGSYHPAIMAFDEAIRLNPNDPRYFSARAKAKAQLGDLDGAAADEKAADALSAKASPTLGQ